VKNRMYHIVYERSSWL